MKQMFSVGTTKLSRKQWYDINAFFGTNIGPCIVTMYDTHERILQKLAEIGQKELFAEMIKGIMDTIEKEDLDKRYTQWLRDTEPDVNHEAVQPISGKEATKDLGEIPQREQCL
jgi:hypothetical protein